MAAKVLRVAGRVPSASVPLRLANTQQGLDQFAAMLEGVEHLEEGPILGVVEQFSRGIFSSSGEYPAAPRRGGAGCPSRWSQKRSEAREPEEWSQSSVSSVWLRRSTRLINVAVTEASARFSDPASRFQASSGERSAPRATSIFRLSGGFSLEVQALGGWTRTCR